MGRRGGVTSITALLAALCWPQRASAAEPSAEDRATATVLFKQAKELIPAGRIHEACEKLEESQRLDPGGGTLLNLAVCHELEGRSASAWVEFTEALRLARRDQRQDRLELAEQHLAALRPKLGTLTIVVPP